MLNKKKNNKIKTYETEYFDIYITTTKDEYEFEIKEKDNNRISFEFGMPKEQQSYEEFLEIVERNLGDAIIWYVKDEMDILSTLIHADTICKDCADERLKTLFQIINEAREYPVSENAYDKYNEIKRMINHLLWD